MIVITGNNGEGSGMFVNYAIANLLKEYPQACITGEFSPLREQLNGTRLFVGELRKPIAEQLTYFENKKFFQLIFDEPIEHHQVQIKNMEKDLSDSGCWVFVVFKSTDKDYARFIQNEYEKLIKKAEI